MSNQIFGFWTVIKKGKNNKHNEIMWTCQCKCGTIKNISSSNLKNNSSTKCKKCRNEEQKQHKFISGKFFGQIKQGAKTRNIDFNLSKNQIGELFNKQNKKCSLTGLELILNYNKEEKNTASLDRINSSKCYEINNVQWVHKTINKMKQDLPQEEFIYFCKLISEKN